MLKPTREALTRAVEIVCVSVASGGKVLVCGNGGSAADAEHIVGELMKSFVLPRKLSDEDTARLQAFEGMAEKLQRGIPAVSLNGHPSLASAIANDTDPAMIYSQQVYVLGREGDVVIGLSTSGNARNVRNALSVARAFGMKTVGFTGSRPSPMDELCDCIIKVPETETFKVQELHLPVYHALCLAVEEELFGVGGL